MAQACDKATDNRTDGPNTEEYIVTSDGSHMYNNNFVRHYVCVQIIILGTQCTINNTI